MAVSLYDCGVITLAMAPVLLFKGRTADNRVDEKEKDDTKVKRSKRKTMITTGPAQGIGGGIPNAFSDPRLQRRCQFARRFQSPGFERRTWR